MKGLIMNTILIVESNKNELEQIGFELAEAYKESFAGEPWFERSKCLNQECEENYSDLKPGCECDKCRQALTDAYNSEELISSWTQILEQGGLIEVDLCDDQIPIRATISRPTNPNELFRRKYDNVPIMRAWIGANLPNEFVWVEDTFANRRIKPAGNLRNRGQTLKTIQTRYDGLQVVTRTISAQIISATFRDRPDDTKLYFGTQRIELKKDKNICAVGEVPDRRSLLVIEGVV
jgi:hypothetical protein